MLDGGGIFILSWLDLLDSFFALSLSLDLSLSLEGEERRFDERFGELDLDRDDPEEVDICESDDRERDLEYERFLFECRSLIFFFKFPQIIF